MFNERLRALRMRYAYTQQNMADMLNITLNAYQKYEQAERAPSFDCLVKIADILQAPTDFLLGRDDYLKSLGVSFDVSQINPQGRPK